MSRQKLTFGAKIKERARRSLVSLKRKPHTIPLCIMLIAFLWYSLQLTTVSNTTASINGAGMGLCGFITMLFSILGLVCFGYAFPHRKPVNKWMLILTLVMFGAVIYADIAYLSTVRTWVYKELAFGTADTIINDLSIIEARQISRLQTKSQISALLNGHIIILIVGLAFTALLPVYSRLLRKINTNIRIDENENMGEIELSGDD